MKVDPPPGYEAEEESEDETEKADETPTASAFDEPTEDDVEDETSSGKVVLTDKVGTNLVKHFEKRKEAFLHDWARSARVCSPCKEVMDDVDNGKNISEEDWQAIERVLRKTMVPEMSNKIDQQQEENRIFNTFKKELLNFHAKRGCYTREGMFDDPLVMSRPDEWHHN